MSTRCLAVILLPLAAILVACESVPSRATGASDIDPLSRDISQSEGGAVHDPTTLAPPPVRREYVQDR